MADFTLKKYAQLCAAISKSAYRTVAFKDFIQQPGVTLNDRLIILRHDVDDRPRFALLMAEIENRYGLTGTYYFRYPQGWNPRIVKAVHDMGHEVGYHYQCMDTARGDIHKARQIFEKELNLFRSVVPVYTAAMHGNPLSPWDNRDFWKHYSLEEFGLTGEAYLSMDFTRVMYYTDTGRTWEDDKYNIKDTIPAGQKALMDKPVLKTTDDLIELVKHDNRNLYINTHPDRWADTWLYWTIFYGYDLLANAIKWSIKHLIR